MALRVVFVCLGNICRSPTAEGVFRHLVDQEDLTHAFEIDSAGTAAYHAGESPDRRSAAAARKRGVKLVGAARQIHADELSSWDYVLAMDRSNHRNLLSLARNEDHTRRIHLLRSFDPSAAAAEDLDVPDPYYGGERGFADVFDICQRACEGLLAHMRRKHGIGSP